MRKSLLLILLLIFFQTAAAQLSFRNQAIYLNRDEDGKKENLLVDWADLNYQYHWLKLGARYEINSPPDRYIFDKDTLVDEFALPFRYAQMRYKRLSLTIGNYYEMFGRGMVLRTYEDRNLRVDNNLDGINFAYRGRKFRAKLLAGKMRDKYNRREEVLYAGDAEYRPFSGLQLGGSLLYQDRRDNNRIIAGRVNYSSDWWDVYAEVARPDWADNPSFYGALNLSFEKLNITMEYKNYDSLSFMNSYETEYNAGPALVREHGFSLLNRHPHQLNQNNERGYQVEATYTQNEMLEFVFNHSRTESHQNQLLYKEYYGHVHFNMGSWLEMYTALAWNEDLSTQNLTPVFDAAFTWSDRDQLHASFQHQHSTNTTRAKDIYKSAYDNEFLLLEYSRSPWLSAALVTEWTNEDQLPYYQQDKENFWMYGQVSFNFWQNQRLSVLYGSRKEGFVCVGGVCRLEPEFNGIEVKLTTRL